MTQSSTGAASPAEAGPPPLERVPLEAVPAAGRRAEGQDCIKLSAAGLQDSAADFSNTLCFQRACSATSLARSNTDQLYRLVSGGLLNTSSAAEQQLQQAKRTRGCARCA